MWDRLLRLDVRRRYLLHKAPPGPMRDYLVAPFPDRSADFRTIEFVSLDLETTGLHPGDDQILSVGLVALRNGRIDLGTARHYRIAPTRSIPERTARIHQITDDEAAKGRPIAEVLPLVLSRLSGCVMLGHHLRIEHAFLDAACRRLYKTAFIIPAVDTAALIRRWIAQRNQPVASRDLRLNALRERFGLPRYKAHNALMDALATAELFCAFVASRNLGKHAPLKLFLERQ